MRNRARHWYLALACATTNPASTDAAAYRYRFRLYINSDYYLDHDCLTPDANMDPQWSQDSLDSLLPLPDSSQPVTPEAPHVGLPLTHGAASLSPSPFSPSQSSRMGLLSSQMTPPPSTQVIPSSQRGKTSTPTPSASHISTPPPTVEIPGQYQSGRATGGYAATMTAEQIALASEDELRLKVAEMQGAYQEAKMAAAHHKLQYQMLSQESAAAMERMSVEARMSQFENEVIKIAEQARAAATPIQRSPFQQGMIPVQKDLYQRMCSEIQQLTEERNFLARDQAHKDKTIMRQDIEIAGLTDKVMLLRDRIRESREQSLNRTARPSSRYEGTPRSAYNDPLRRGVSNNEQPQPFAALLQASEMASQEARRPANSRKGHVRNAQSTSSLPVTPNRGYKQHSLYQTPQGRRPPPLMPSTAPPPRTSALRNADVYTQHVLPVARQTQPGHLSDGTVSASEDDDSEAETDIIEPDAINESQASRTASQMLRSSQDDRREKQVNFEGSGMLSQSSETSSAERLRQTKLFGPVRKGAVERYSDEPPAKRARTVGLGIAGVRD